MDTPRVPLIVLLHGAGRNDLDIRKVLPDPKEGMLDIFQDLLNADKLLRFFSRILPPWPPMPRAGRVSIQGLNS
jgi:predicted esterase